MKVRIFGGLLIVSALILFAVVAFHNSKKRQQPVIFSITTTLNALWRSYKKEYLEPGTGRTLDKQRNNITTSEGESYTMLRAVWLDDKVTFDQSWQWTQDNLHRSGDHLFSWMFGQKADGSYGVVTEQGGQNTASDADTDIAVALLFAYSRWQDKVYLQQAQGVISDIWNKEVIIINNQPYLVASNTEKESSGNTALINPSYFAPYAYRMFAKVDTSHDWTKLIDTSYQVIQSSSTLLLDKTKTANLPPDWISINKQNGEIKAPEQGSLTTNYGYDAMRTSWRLALDWEWYKEPRAQTTLGLFSYLAEQWNSRKILSAVYEHDGQISGNFEAPAIYGGDIGYFIVTDENAAQDIFSTKLKVLYNPDSQSWKQPLGYYDDNWAWFGLALSQNSLPNLFANSSVSLTKFLWTTR